MLVFAGDRTSFQRNILVGGFKHSLFLHILGIIIIPADFHIFQRGRSTTNQYIITSLKGNKGYGAC